MNEHAKNTKIPVHQIKRTIRALSTNDLKRAAEPRKSHRTKLRRLYQKLDTVLLRHLPRLARTTSHDVAMRRIRAALSQELGYKFHEVDVERPWGGFFRIVDEQTDKFLADFFPGLTQEEARLGMEGTDLSPKIMVWEPGKRISWQYHHRRTERWHFLTEGRYWRSDDDVLPDPVQAKPGEIVQYRLGERHRGGALSRSYTLVAEIWQHTDPQHPSDEADIIRLEDDYGRPKHPGRV